MADHDYKQGGWRDKYVIFKKCKDCEGTGDGPCTCPGNGIADCQRPYGHHGECRSCGGTGMIAVDPNAVYFVLRLDEDRHAVKAAIEYAKSIRDENSEFADDILAKLHKIVG